MLCNEDIIETNNIINKLIQLKNNKLLLNEFIKDNNIRNTFILLLDKGVSTNLSDKKLNKKVSSDTRDKTLNNYSDFIEYLLLYSSGKYSSIATIKYFIEQFKNNEDVYNTLYLIASKKLKLGIGLAFYNKIAKKYDLGLINDFKPQLAKNIDDINKKDYLKEGFVLTEKLDGVRCICLFDQNSNIHFYTRSGKIIDGLEQLKKNILKIGLLQNTVLDGELLFKDNKEKAEDTFRATVKIVESKGIKENINYNVFDFLSYDDFFNSLSADYFYRRNDLNSLSEYIKNKNIKFINVVPELYRGNDIEKIYSYMNKVVNSGGEGVMVNTLSGRYQNKRTKDLLKVKQFKENDGIIKDIYEGEGRNKGKLGGVVITYKNKVVKIGSGFSDKEREKYWKNSELILGKIGTYRFTTESKNEKDDLIDLRFGRWIGLRFDKSELDVSYDN